MNYIPIKVDYICKKEQTVSCYFREDLEGKKPIKEVDCVPIYAVDHGKMTSANINWAGTKNPEIITTVNEKIKNVIVVNYQPASTTRMTFKVLINGYYLAEIREDVLLEAMLTVGIDKGGKLNGEYIWGHNAQGLRLIRIGSTVFKDYIAVIKSVKKIPNKDIKIGGVYKRRSGKQYMYLGQFKTISYKHDGVFETNHEDINGRFVSRDVFLYKILSSKLYERKKLDMFSCDPLFHFLDRNLDVAPHDYILTSHPATLSYEEGFIDLSSVDYISLIKQKTIEFENLKRSPITRKNIKRRQFDILNLRCDSQVHEVFRDLKIPYMDK